MFDRLLIGGDGPLQVGHLPQRLAQVVMRVRESVFQLDRPLKATCRLFETFQPILADTEVVPCLGMVGRLLNGLSQLHGRRGKVALLIQQRPQVVSRIRTSLIQLQRSANAFLSFMLRTGVFLDKPHNVMCPRPIRAQGNGLPAGCLRGAPAASGGVYNRHVEPCLCKVTVQLDSLRICPFRFVKPALCFENHPTCCKPPPAGPA